ncbi:MAG: S-adenosylmethionine:tRNA ribosyltransferase-isomerase [Dysgonamonadaceae bacterium]|jgi:S-adenosylmethionine:tRNA ribosyltransferase-isomerase|nr:S-adenosylmethionine:tRNA ribosyltransferase-isomerase [Dysgonamonadaceae bacterium]
MKKDEIGQLRISKFNYKLPDGKIAKYPLTERDSSKLLLYRDGKIGESVFKKLSEQIPAGSLMIFNNTKVIHARLLFRKETGATIEIFCLSPAEPSDYALNFVSRGQCSWHCMIGNAKRWKNEPLLMRIETRSRVLTLEAEKLSAADNDTVVRFSWDDEACSFSELLELAGKLPIPPYLNRPTEEKDEETYQTVYSKIEGSVAAPTAGLHFTDGVMRRLHEKGVVTSELTLHVGAGTFKPVKSETMDGHEMHTECISVSRKTVELLLNRKKTLVVVGTTSMRTIESLYYIGCKLQMNPQAQPHELAVSQWEAYEDPFGGNITPEQALQNILDYLDRTGESQLITATQIMIAPGFRFRFADAIVTNFHQPQSTLLLLISAFVGSDWRNIYDYALSHDFRFLSYGDSSLLWKNTGLMQSEEQIGENDGQNN